MAITLLDFRGGAAVEVVIDGRPKIVINPSPPPTRKEKAESKKWMKQFFSALRGRNKAYAKLAKMIHGR